LAVEALASSPFDIELLSRAGHDADDLDEWLAATQRASPEALKPCPVSCSAAGDSAGWFLFPVATSLTACNDTMLLEMAVQRATTTDGKDAQPAIRAYTAD
jgi:hypothetical protein